MLQPLYEPGRKHAGGGAINPLDVSIVVPVYRNSETLPELHRRICHVLESRGFSFEILFVDDACPVGSLTVLRAISQGDPRVAVLAMERNVGQHRAALLGLSHALGEWAVVLDADLQDPPEAIPDLLVKGQDGFAAVFAGRRGNYESPFRLFTSRLFKSLLNLLCSVPADAGMFMALNRSMLERLAAFNPPGLFLVAMVGCADLPIASIPVERAPRPIGSSAYNWAGRLKSGWRAITWVLAWKLRGPRWRAGNGRAAPEVKAYIGARFTLPDGTAEL